MPKHKSRQVSQNSTKTGMASRSRVDRWIDWIKDHRILSLVLFGAIILVSLEKFTGAVKALGDDWQNWQHPPSKMLVEPLVHLQTPFSIEPRPHRDGENGPELDIEWNGYFALTNLTEHPLVITRFEPKFEPALGSGFNLVQENQENLTAYVAVDELTFRDRPPTKDPDEKLLRIGSIIIPPGAKQFVAFHLIFDVFQGEEQLNFTDSTKAAEAVSLAAGAYIDEKGHCHAMYGPIGGTFAFADGTKLNFSAQTMQWVSGCNLEIPY